MIKSIMAILIGVKLLKNYYNGHFTVSPSFSFYFWPFPGKQFGVFMEQL